MSEPSNRAGAPLGDAPAVSIDIIGELSETSIGIASVGDPVAPVYEPTSTAADAGLDGDSE